MDETKTTDKIVFRLVRTNVFTRWPCHICGGETDKDAILCEAASPFSDHGTLRICPQCLQCRNFDHYLEQHAQGLSSQAAAIRSLIGRIEAPSFAEWERATADDNAEWEREERAAGRGAQVDEINTALADLYGPDDESLLRTYGIDEDLF